MGTAAVKIKSQLPKEEDENGLDWNSSRVFLQALTEQHIIVAYVHTGQIIEDYDADFGSRTPVLVVDAVEWMGSILDAPEAVRQAFQARHARRTGGGVTLLDELQPAHRVLAVTHQQLLECLAGLDLDLASLDALADGIDPATGEIVDSDEAMWIILPESYDEMTDEMSDWYDSLTSKDIQIGVESGGLSELVAYFRVGSKRLDRYATGMAADLWPTDKVTSAVVRYACQIILGSLTYTGPTNLRYTHVRETISALYDAANVWPLTVPQLHGFLLEPLSEALDRWAAEHPWDAGAMDLLGATR